MSETAELRKIDAQLAQHQATVLRAKVLATRQALRRLKPDDCRALIDQTSFAIATARKLIAELIVAKEKLARLEAGKSEGGSDGGFL